MALIVQKYGGTSVVSAERIKAVAGRIIARVKGGDRLVVVVSAMGQTTDELIALAAEMTDEPEAREMDLLLSTGEIVTSTLLAMALKHSGQPALALSGAQAGIGTDQVYGRARILKLDPARVVRELDAGAVVIVAGFQGVTEEMEIATLGRGGSDTTAVALAAALKAERCEICTDVDGVYTADPRIEPAARKLQDITYELIDEADGDTHTFFIPAGSFQPRGQDTFRFESRSIKAKFELDKCEFEFAVIDGHSFDDMDGPDITVRLITSASGFGEQTVTTEVDDDELEFEAEREPDCCAGQPHRADLDHGGSVDLVDLQLLISNWGACPDCGNCPADIDGDCAVGVGDLLILLANWTA